MKRKTIDVDVDEEMKRVKNDHDLSVVIPNKVYLGNERASQDKQLLLQHNVTAILNCSNDCKNYFEDTFKYLHIEIEDDHDVVLSKYYGQVHDFLNQNGVIFVHCQSGVSRSASLLLSWLMKSKGGTLDQCYYQLKSIRSIVLPNVSFMYQLSLYDKEIYGKQTFNMIEYMTEFFFPLFEDIMQRKDLYDKIQDICSSSSSLDMILEKIYDL